ncbi:hypothetical protein D3C71_2135610 [compost metagenome]
MVATAAKAHFRKFGIDIHIHWLAGIEEQGGCLFFGQIAARMRLRSVKLQAGQLGHDRLSG